MDILAQARVIISGKLHDEFFEVALSYAQNVENIMGAFEMYRDRFGVYAYPDIDLNWS
jgi:hypothetical protein